MTDTSYDYPKLVREAFIASFTSFHATEKLPRAEVSIQEKLTRYCSGLDQALLNGVIENALDVEERKEELAKVKAHFQEKGLPFSWWLDQDQNSPVLQDFLKEEGFNCPGLFMGLYKDLREEMGEERLPPGVALERIVPGDERWETWVDVFRQSFKFSEEAAVGYMEMMISMDDHPELTVRHYLGICDGQPAAVGSTLAVKRPGLPGIGYLCNAGVLEPFRRRGIGQASAHRRLLDLKSGGCEVATIVLMSDAMAQGYCSRLGFEKCYRLYPYLFQA